MTVVVTGASGHVGNNLVRALLAEGRSVRVLCAGSPEQNRSLSGLPIEVVSGDVCDFAAVRRTLAGASAVFHLAALISINEKDHARLQAVNVGGTENVVRACRELAVPRLVHMSSVHALSVFPPDEPIDETRPLVSEAGSLAYDRSKAAGERVVLRAVAEGLDAVIVSPAAVLGPNDYGPSLSAQGLLAMMRSPLPVTVPGAYNWVDVRDVVEGTIAAEKRGRRGERYLLSGHLCTVRALATLLAEVAGSPPPRITLPAFCLRLALPFVAAHSRLTGKRALYTANALKILASNCDFRNDKARRELGFSVRPLHDTVVDAISSYRRMGYI